MFDCVLKWLTNVRPLIRWTLCVIDNKEKKFNRVSCHIIFHLLGTKSRSPFKNHNQASCPEAEPGKNFRASCYLCLWIIWICQKSKTIFSIKSGVEVEINLSKENQNKKKFKTIYEGGNWKQYMKNWAGL